MGRRELSISLDVSEKGHCVTRARRLPSELKGERCMTRVRRERPFRYAVLTGARWRGRVSAVHEPSPTGSPDRASLTAPAAKTKPRLAVYSHIIEPDATEQDVIPTTRKSYSGPVELGEDLMVVVVGEKVEVRRLTRASP
jgi:hypothetical protein